MDPEYEEIHINRQAQELEVVKQDAKESSKRKIGSVIGSQFDMEIEGKELELDQIEKVIQEAHLKLDQLRACIVMKYYAGEPIQMTEAANSWIHPTPKKYTGKTVSSVMAAFYNDHDYINTRLPSGPEETLDTLNLPLRSVKSKESSSKASHRFKRNIKIVVGNISKYMLHKEEKDRSTHKWMIYVRLKNGDENIKALIKKVLFFLHPSYKPNDLVEMRDAPFYLCRRGWGEFPVRVQIHFHYHQNKPFDIIHNLRLDKTFTGLQTLGSETVVDVPLYVSDECQEVVQPSLAQGSIPTLEPHESPLEDKLVVPPVQSKVEQKYKLVMVREDSDPKNVRYFLCPTGHGSSVKGVSILNRKSEEIPDAWKAKRKDFDQSINRDFIQKISLDDYASLSEFMLDFIKWFPLQSEYPYFSFCASSNQVFESWNIGKQRACEWLRAKEIHRRLKEFSSEKWNTWSVKQILLWARQSGYIPHNYIKRASHIPSKKKRLSGETICGPEGLLRELAMLEMPQEEEQFIEVEKIQGETLSPTKRSQRSSWNPFFDKPVEDTDSMDALLTQISKCLIGDILHLSLQNGAATLGGKMHPDLLTIEDVYSGITSLSKFDSLTSKYLGIS